MNGCLLCGPSPNWCAGSAGFGVCFPKGEVAMFDTPEVPEDHNGCCGACHTYPCSCEQLNEAAEYENLRQQRKELIERHVDKLVDSWIEQYAWRADERPRLPTLRRLIRELLGESAALKEVER